MSQMRILSIDDNPQNLKLIELALVEQFEVLSSNGSEPIETLLESFKPDVILLDIMLGEKSGYDVCKNIRHGNVGSNVVVIFISSLASLDDKLTAYAAGGDDYVCKPINIQELERKLCSLEKRIEQQHELESQYETAAMAAYSSMQQSSELGQLIAFFTDTMELTELDALYEATMSFVSHFGSQCVVEFRFDEQNYQYPSHGVATLESEILELGRSAKRIISFGNNLLLNSSWCSLLIKKMPLNDADLVGRLRDHYAILLGIIDSRIMLIESQQNRQGDRAQVIGQISSALDTGLGRIKNELHEQELQAQAIVQQLESSMSIGLMSLGLSEEQERALMSIVEETRERFESMVGMSIQIDNEIRQIDHLLGKIA